MRCCLNSQPPAEQPVPVTVGVDRAVAAPFEADRDVLLRIQLDQFGAVVADPGNICTLTFRCPVYDKTGLAATYAA